MKCIAGAVMSALPALSVAQTGSTKATQALTQVTKEVSSLLDGASNLALAIAGVIAVVGVIMVFTKIQQGDNQAAKTIGGWFGGIFFVVLAIGVVIKAFFA